jgi:hypothetical protein
MATEGNADQVQVSAFNVQVGGSHYKEMAIQPIEYILANKLGFAEGTVIKYVSRWRAKGGIDDLRKARHVLDMLIESEESTPKTKASFRGPTEAELESLRTCGVYLAPDPIAEYARRVVGNDGPVDWAEPFLQARKALKELEKHGQFGEGKLMMEDAERVIALMNEIRRQAL